MDSKAMMRSNTRILYLVDHRTLTPAEVSVLQSVGAHVSVPTLTQDGPIPRSYDETIPSDLKKILLEFDFLNLPWTPKVIDLVNLHFDTIVTSVHHIPFTEVITHFRSQIVLRVFGREAPNNYTSFFTLCMDHKDLFKHFTNKNIIFGQGYSNISSIEDDFIASKAVTIPLTLPIHIKDQQNSFLSHLV